MYKTSQDKNASTPRRIFPLSPEMVRRLRAMSSSKLLQIRTPKTDQEQTA